jgi:protein-L-isoaspartate(D-aspartate) O-methyltransferase
MTWIDRQLRARGIADERVLAAMAAVPRELFVPAAARAHAYDDSALPLAHGQTVSQPYIVALICQSLALEPGDRVLDVGTGSGYQAAVLAELGARVFSVERIPELADEARAALAAAGYEVDVRVGDGSRGLPDEAPFAGIAVAAAAREIPRALWRQLADGGRIVLPLRGRLGQRLCVYERSAAGDRLVATTPARFVPLVVESPAFGEFPAPGAGAEADPR